MRWIVSSAKKRSEKNMSTKLAGELIDAADGRGEAVKKRQDTHKMAEATKLSLTLDFNQCLQEKFL